MCAVPSPLYLPRYGYPSRLCSARPTPSRGLPQVCNVVMTLLQWFWSSLILKAIYFKAIGDARAKEA